MVSYFVWTNDAIMRERCQRPDPSPRKPFSHSSDCARNLRLQVRVTHRSTTLACPGVRRRLIQFPNPLVSQIKQLAKHCPIKRMALRGALNFDEPS